MSSDSPVPRARGRSVSFCDAQGYDHQQTVGHLLFKLVTSLRREVESRMAEFGLTDAQWKPLWLLAQGRGSTAFELSREMGIDAGATTRMLDRLEAKGLLERVRSETDRRVVDVRLTDEGHDVVKHVPHVLAGVNNDYLRGFTKQEWTQIKDLLQRMVANGEVLQQAESDGAAS